MPEIILHRIALGHLRRFNGSFHRSAQFIKDRYNDLPGDAGASLNEMSRPSCLSPCAPSGCYPVGTVILSS